MLVQRSIELTGKSTPRVHDRNLVAAGYRTSSGRGRSAPTITALDLAYHLTAVLGSEHLTDSVKTVERYRETHPVGTEGSKRPFKGCGIPLLEALPPEHDFIVGLEALFLAGAAGQLAEAAQLKAIATPRRGDGPAITVATLWPGTLGEIRLAGLASGETFAVRYGLHTPWDAGKKPTSREIDAWEKRLRQQRCATDIETLRRVSERTILGLAELLESTEES
jgi:hypothetical protein